jgi:hypothetical protein
MIACTPSVGHLVDLEDEEGLGGRHARDAVDPLVQHLLEVGGVAADDLDEHVVLAGDGGDVAGLGELLERLAHGVGGTGVDPARRSAP